MIDTTPSRHFDPNTRDALIHAALMGNTEAIDNITDCLVQQGMCRPRTDMSRMAEWILRRPADAKPVEGGEAIVAEAAVADIGALMAEHFRGVFAGVGQ